MAVEATGEHGVNVDGNTVKVIVGLDERTFHVHENLVRKQSPFFDATMSHSWKESKERTITLPEDDAKLFAEYLQWLYFRKLRYYRSDVTEQYDTLVDLYIFGEKCMDTTFQNEVIDCIVKSSRVTRLPNQAAKSTAKDRFMPNAARIIRKVYENTPQDSPLRRLLVDLHVVNGTSDWLDEDMKANKKDFLFDLAVATSNKRVLKQEFAGDYSQLEEGTPSKYHLEERNLRGIPIKICIGSDSSSEDFYVHEHVLTSHSAFLTAALDNNWQEAHDRAVNLSLDEPGSFYIYVQYLYTGILHLDSIEANARNLVLCKLYCLGEKLIDPAFQDMVLDALVTASRVRDPDTNRRCVPLKSDKVNLIYDGTPVGSPMRQLVVDMAVSCGHGGWKIESQDPPYHPEYLAQLCAALMEKRKVEAEILEEYIELVEGVPVTYHKIKPTSGEGGAEDGAVGQA